MTNIEWVKNADGTKGKTWNPVTGCTKVSAGCWNCYAERMAKRLAGRYGYPEQPNHFDVTLHEDKLGEPGRWKKPRQIFVCSMSDLFHGAVPFDYIGKVFGTIAEAKQHTFQVLTKRPDRMGEFLEGWQAVGQHFLYVPSNIWFGVSVENQNEVCRIEKLVQISAAVRFVSFEPLLGPVNFTDQEWWDWRYSYGFYPPSIARKPIDWVIAGCESDPKRRPCDIDWIRSVRDQCVAADIPFFLKQMDIDGKVVKMPELDGRVWDQMPEVETHA